MPFSPAQIADRLADVIDSLRSVVSALPVAGVAPSTVSTIETVLNDAEATLQAFSASDSNQADIVRRIGSDLSAVLTALAALPLPPAAVLPVRIASMVVPLIVAAAQLIWPTRSVAANQMLLEVSAHAA